MKTSVEAIILAAGASERMKFPKALLEIEGQTALEKIVEACRLNGIQNPIVVLGAHADAIRKKANLRDAKILENENWLEGQSSSVKKGLEGLEKTCEWFLIWPVDLPLVSPETLRSLISAQPRAGAKILIPQYQDRRGHPIRIHRDLEGEIKKLDSDEPLHLVVHADSDRVQEVTVDSPGILRDLNTPEDYKRWAR